MLPLHPGGPDAACSRRHYPGTSLARRPQRSGCLLLPLLSGLFFFFALPAFTSRFQLDDRLSKCAGSLLIRWDFWACSSPSCCLKDVCVCVWVSADVGCLSAERHPETPVVVHMLAPPIPDVMSRSNLTNNFEHQPG